MSLLTNGLRTFKEFWKCTLFFILLFGLIPMPLLIGNVASRCAYVLILMSGFWIFNVIPLSLTAAIPLMLFPFLGILDSKTTCHQYMTTTAMLFIGGLFFAMALEVSNIHMRIAMKLLVILGTKFSRVILGFMLTTTFLSLWINNTASAAMMIPIAEAVLIELHHQNGNESPDERSTILRVDKNDENESVSLTSNKLYRKQKIILLLAIAFSANIGGIGVLTGSGTNLVLKGLVEDIFHGADVINFGRWMMYNIPGTILRILASYGIFYFFYFVLEKDNVLYESPQMLQKTRERIHERYEALGPINFHQGAIIFLFIFVVMSWFFRQHTFVPGWGSLFPKSFGIDDTTVSMVAAALLFLIPRDISNLKKSKSLVEWKYAIGRIPWGIIFILGGGFSLAEGSKRTGLSVWIASQISTYGTLKPFVMQLIVCIFAAIMTQFVSNSATASILLPMIAEISVITKVNPIYYMLPVTVSSSFAFMLPAGTPPNALVYEEGQMTNLDMAKPGFCIAIVSLIIEIFSINTLGVLLFDVNSFPSWAIRT